MGDHNLLLDGESLLNMDSIEDFFNINEVEELDYDSSIELPRSNYVYPNRVITPDKISTPIGQFTPKRFIAFTESENHVPIKDDYDIQIKINCGLVVSKNNEGNRYHQYMNNKMRNYSSIYYNSPDTYYFLSTGVSERHIYTINMNTTRKSTYKINKGLMMKINLKDMPVFFSGYNIQKTINIINIYPIPQESLLSENIRKRENIADIFICSRHGDPRFIQNKKHENFLDDCQRWIPYVNFINAYYLEEIQQFFIFTKYRLLLSDEILKKDCLMTAFSIDTTWPEYDLGLIYDQECQIKMDKNNKIVMNYGLLDEFKSEIDTFEFVLPYLTYPRNEEELNLPHHIRMSKDKEKKTLSIVEFIQTHDFIELIESDDNSRLLTNYLLYLGYQCDDRGVVRGLFKYIPYKMFYDLQARIYLKIKGVVSNHVNLYRNALDQPNKDAYESYVFCLPAEYIKNFYRLLLGSLFGIESLQSLLYELTSNPLYGLCKKKLGKSYEDQKIQLLLMKTIILDRKRLFDSSIEPSKNPSLIKKKKSILYPKGKKTSKGIKSKPAPFEYTFLNKDEQEQIITNSERKKLQSSSKPFFESTSNVITRSMLAKSQGDI